MSVLRLDAAVLLQLRRRAVSGYIRFFRGKIWRPEQLDLAQMGGDFVFDRNGNPHAQVRQHKL